MLRTSLLALLALSAAPAFAETRSYDFKSFTKLDISAGYEVIFTQAPQRSVTIESDDFSKITAEQTGDTLRIGRPRNTNLRGKVHDVVRISAPDLDAAELTAGVKFSTDSLKVDDLSLDINAGVEARFSGVQARSIRLDLNAGVDVSLDGECQSVKVDANAGIDLKAGGLKCKSATVDAGVGSSVRIYAADSVTAKADIGASVRIAGSPKSVDKRASFGGSVSLD